MKEVTLTNQQHNNEAMVFMFMNKFPVRVIKIGDDPWFVARDVTDALGLYPTQTRRLDDDEKGLHPLQTPGGTQRLTIISESGAYALALHSNKPELREFRRWVTEVIREIRQNGLYVADPDKMSAPSEYMLIARLANRGEELARKLADHDLAIDMISERVGNIFNDRTDGTARQKLRDKVVLYAKLSGVKIGVAWNRFKRAYDHQYDGRIEAKITNYMKSIGWKKKKRMTKPEYLEAVGDLENGHYVIDILLDKARRLKDAKAKESKAA